jgi:iron complex outermembrane receptor protein
LIGITSAAYAEENEGLSYLPEVTVTGSDVSSLTVPSNGEARQQLKRVAGGVALVEAEDFADTYSLNLEDNLAYVAGVYAQKRYGEEVRLSIRGSGLSRGFHLRGIHLLQDGIPFNLADGSADFQESDPLAMQRLEIFKGANALQFGSTTLGGAVNMVSKTGKSHAGDALRLEAGSFNTYRTHIESGRELGNSDVYVSATALSSGGYRQHDDQQSLKLNGNVGVKVNNDVETRFYLSANNINQDLPGSVSKRSALDTPRRADRSADRDDQQRDIRSLRVANKTTIELNDNHALELGAFANIKDLFHPITPFVGTIDQESQDYGGYVQGRGEYQLAGYRNTYQLGLKAHLGNIEAKVFENIRGSRGRERANADQSAQNFSLYGENQFYIVPEWALVTGAQLTTARRKVEDNIARLESDAENYDSINPKLGMMYEPSSTVQLFTNVSRSYEPPTFSEVTQSGTVGFTPLDAQNAWTAEVGSRGSYDMVAWDVSLYRAWIKDELLQYNIAANIPASTFNAGDTIHQGAEVGLDVYLADSIVTDGDSVQLQSSYTYSDFYFEGDAQYGDNTIAGQPKHFYQAQLRYDHADGWYVAPHIELASDAEVDFANTLQAAGYGVIGLGGGVDVNERVHLFVDGRNLLDKRYISTFSTLTNGAIGASNVFFPAEGRAFFAGIHIKL